MHRLFLDANVLFSAAYKASRIRELWELDVALLTSSYALQEVRRNLITIRPQAIEMLDSLLSRVTLTKEGNVAVIPPDIALPKKDKPILAAALQSRATHLITGDFKHFGRYYGQSVGYVRILPPAQYFQSL